MNKEHSVKIQLIKQMAKRLKEKYHFRLLKKCQIKQRNSQSQFMLNDDFANSSPYYTRCQHSDAVSELTTNLPKWGGIRIIDENHEFYHSYNKLKFINTCSIDYLLL